MNSIACTFLARTRGEVFSIHRTSKATYPPFHTKTQINRSPFTQCQPQLFETTAWCIISVCYCFCWVASASLPHTPNQPGLNPVQQLIFSRKNCGINGSCFCRQKREIGGFAINSTITRNNDFFWAKQNKWWLKIPVYFGGNGKGKLTRFANKILLLLLCLQKIIITEITNSIPLFAKPPNISHPSTLRV